MTAPTRRGTGSIGVWVLLLAAVGLIVLLAWSTSDDPVLGGFADPVGTGPQGLRGLVLLVEESGGEADLDVATPGPEVGAALLATNAYQDILGELNDDTSGTEANVEPLLDWVESGGVLVTSVDLPGGPEGAVVFDSSDDPIARGACTIDRVDGVESLRSDDWEDVVVGDDDQRCFGTDSAFVVERRLGDGAIVRLGSMDVFFNRRLDDVDNAALAARLLRLGDGAQVAFLSGPEGTALAGDVPTNEDGEPVGAGDSTLLDLLHPGVVPMIVGLAIATLLYVLARGRRLGSPVEEPVPIELAGSGHVEAVGRLYRRLGDPQAHTSQQLRDEFRTTVIRRSGLPADIDDAELLAVLEPDIDRRRALAERLTGTVSNNDALVDLAADLNERRRRLEGRDSAAAAVASTLTDPNAGGARIAGPDPTEAAR